MKVQFPGWCKPRPHATRQSDAQATSLAGASPPGMRTVPRRAPSRCLAIRDSARLRRAVPAGDRWPVLPVGARCRAPSGLSASRRDCIFTANAHDRGGCTPRRHVTGWRLSLRCWACFGFFACLIDDSVGSGRGRCQLGALVPEQQTVPTDGFAPRSVSGSSVNAQQLEPHPRLGDGCVLIVRRFPLPPQTPTPRRKSHDRERHPEHHLRPRRRPGCPQDGDHRQRAPRPAPRRAGDRHENLQRLAEWAARTGRLAAPVSDRGGGSGRYRHLLGGTLRSAGRRGHPALADEMPSTSSRSRGARPTSRTASGWPPSASSAWDPPA